MSSSVRTLPQHNFQIPPGNRREAVNPLHILVRSARILNLESTEEMGDEEVEFCISKIDADTRPRAPGKGNESTLHFLLVTVGGIGKPALGLECLRIFEGVRVLVVDVCAGRNNGL